MTIEELLKKNEIDYSVIEKSKPIQLIRVADTNVMIWINEGNVFKLKRSCFEILESNCSKYVVMLLDKSNKKYYYIKFQEKNNWLSSGFYSCDKSEIFIGKQVLNYESTIPKIISELKKIK